MAIKDDIWEALKKVRYPGYTRDIVSFGLVHQVTEDDGIATLVIDMAQVVPERHDDLLASLQEQLRDVEGLRGVRVEASRATRGRPRPARQPVTNVRPAARGPQAATERPAGVRRVIAVGSGKGGVGKSTVAANLAVALARAGQRVGLLDADAYGPNVPRMMGATELPPASNGRLQPAEAHGVRLVSVGFLASPETPLVWRGPMTDKMVRQFLTDVAWGDLDVLVVDLPPSTGDVPLSLVKHSWVDGAIVVVTPQEVAADDARKALGMFQQLNVPVLGVVENMSYFVCDGCGERHHLFGEGGGRRLAEENGVPFLGEIPLEPAVRAGGDEGRPAVLLAGSQAGSAFRALADTVRQRLENGDSLPEI